MSRKSSGQVIEKEIWAGDQEELKAGEEEGLWVGEEEELKHVRKKSYELMRRKVMGR